MIRVGVISDTHGLLRPQAVAALAGSNFIIHGGDIGNAGILADLAAIAPLTVVRGNNDKGPWAHAVPTSAMLNIGPVRIHAVHDIATIGIDPGQAGVQIVIYGHSHRPRVEQRGPILYLNPGSAGPRRFKLPVSVALLDIDGDTIQARIVELQIP